MLFTQSRTTQHVGLLLGAYFGLAALAITAATVTHSPDPLTTIGWGLGAVIIAGMVWAIGRGTEHGTRTSFGITHQTPDRYLDQVDHTVQGWQIAAGATGAYLAVHALQLAATPNRPLLLGVMTALTVGLLADLVLLGALTATIQMPWWGVVTVSVLARLSLVGTLDWSLLLAAVGSGVVVALLYTQTRRLTPILVGQTVAAVAVGLFHAWYLSL